MNQNNWHILSETKLPSIREVLKRRYGKEYSDEEWMEKQKEYSNKTMQVSLNALNAQINKNKLKGSK